MKWLTASTAQAWLGHIHPAASARDAGWQRWEEAHRSKDRLWGVFGDVLQQGSRVREWVVQDDGVADADVLQRPTAVIADGLINGV